MQTVRRGAFVWKLRYPDLDGDWLRHPERLLKEMQSVRKRPSSSPQTRVVRFKWNERDLVVKEYDRRRWRTIGRALVRGPRSLQAFKIALRLEQLGIPGIRAIAAGYKGGQPWYSLLVTEEIRDVLPLYTWLKHSRESLKPVVHSAARLFAGLHNAGLIHRDAHETNFVVPQNRRRELIMVDVDGVRESRRVTLRQAAKDLSRLHVRLRDLISTTTRLRFLAEYSRLRCPKVSSREVIKAFAAIGTRLR